ncbi:hypothetical protein [Streptomyces bikiniensis]|uniref:hypothetical protein n=1 Tax=Streptomyces bikiniensis TaxID=1896 RepID=UPI0004C0B08D|nr:hypothetical protein [Streptomyces bikiniensis]
MKQSAKKLGVAALGAAFAAAAAGTASAAPVAPAAPDALGLVSQTVPLGDGLGELPADAAEGLHVGQGVLGQGLDQATRTLPAAAGQVTQNLPLDAAAGGLGATPLGGLLGGLPLNGLPLNGLPLG